MIANLIYFVQPITYQCEQWNDIPYPSGLNEKKCLVIPINFGEDNFIYSNIKINAETKKTFYVKCLTPLGYVPPIKVGFIFIKTI